MRLKTIFSITCLAATAATAAENLHLKPGLWQITSQSEGGPQLSDQQKAQMEKAMERMPAEQRARMEANMKRAGGAPSVNQSCVLADDLKKPMYDPSRSGSKCTSTILNSTTTSQEVRVECENNGRKSTGTFKMIATSPESWNSTLDLVMDGLPTPMKTKMSGKWLSSDCGSVKPASQK